jgi:hypothetical protein
MKLLTRIITFLVITLISLFTTRPVFAIPPLPSSFYGTVKANGANVPDGTLVKASINGIVYAEGKTQTYQGDSVYSLDIPGDDTDTTVKDGGQNGDTIIFTIGKTAAAQTGTWKGGTNVEINLSISKIAAQDKPLPTITQTAIDIVTPIIAAPTKTAQPTPTTGVLLQASPQPTALVQPSSTVPVPLVQPTSSEPAVLVQLSPTVIAVTGPENNSADFSKTKNVIGIVVVFLILFIVLWYIFIRKPKV